MKTKITRMLIIAIMATLTTACSGGQTDAPEKIAEEYVREHIHEITEEATKNDLENLQRNEKVKRALARGLQPFQCRVHRPDDLNAEGDLRCNLTMSTQIPVEIEIKVPVDVTLEWEHKDGEKNATGAESFQVQVALLWTSHEGKERFPERTKREETPTPVKPIRLGSATEYARCIDATYLRASQKYDDQYSLPAAVWYCQHIEPLQASKELDNRCYLNRIKSTQHSYPEWDETIRHWYAVVNCGPRASGDIEHIRAISGIRPTQYGACLDNTYLAFRERGGDNEITVGMTAWICRNFLGEPPKTYRPRCELNNIADTKELFPEWPERLHNWHAIMECVPHWRENRQTGETVYQTCLGDIYLEISNRYSKEHAIPAAVWRCRKHMPEQTENFNPRCELNFQRKDDKEEQRIQWPDELYKWNSIVHCYPKYRG